jgi:ABC-type multidrug transport system permease subunit
LGYRWALRVAGFICFFFLVLATIFVKQSPAHLAIQSKRDENHEGFREMFSRQKKLLQNTEFNIMLIVGFITTFGYLVSFIVLTTNKYFKL